jgi:hypothetical protein
MSRIDYREKCPTCGSETWCGFEAPPQFQPVPLTVDLRADLWRYFGENYNDGGWPSLPPESVRINMGRMPDLLDTPFTRAFLVWRTRGDRS